MNTATDEAPETVNDLLTMMKNSSEKAARSHMELICYTPQIVEALKHRSGQSAKIESILWSLWNDEHPVHLGDALSGLDFELSKAVMAMIAARAYQGGNADSQLKQIIEEAGIEPPETSSTEWL